MVWRVKTYMGRQKNTEEEIKGESDESESDESDSSESESNINIAS